MHPQQQQQHQQQHEQQQNNADMHHTWPGYAANAWLSNPNNSYNAQYSAYYQYWMRYGGGGASQQQSQQQQQQDPNNMVSSSLCMSNAPPGFSNAVMPQIDLKNPPLPPGPHPGTVSMGIDSGNNGQNGNQMQQQHAMNKNNFNCIRFNLNQPKRLINSTNPLQLSSMSTNAMKNSPPLSVMGGNVSKKKRKRQKNKNNVNQQQVQTHQATTFDNSTSNSNNNNNNNSHTVPLNAGNYFNTSVPPPPTLRLHAGNLDVSRPPPLLGGVDLSRAPAPPEFPSPSKKTASNGANNLFGGNNGHKNDKAASPAALGGIAGYTAGQLEMRRQMENSNSVLSTAAENPSPAKSSNPFESPNDAWPESLNMYVARCYAKCSTDLDKDQVDICLKGKIIAAANRNELWTRDWTNEPIPSVHSERNNKPRIELPHAIPSINAPKKMAVDNNIKGIIGPQLYPTKSANKNHKNFGGNIISRLGQYTTSITDDKSARKLMRKSRSPAYGKIHKQHKSHSRSSSASPRRHLTGLGNSGGDSEANEQRFQDNSYIPLSTKTNKHSNLLKKKDKKNKNNTASSSNNSSSSVTSSSSKIPFYGTSVGGSVVNDSARLQQRAQRFSQGSRSSKKVSEGGDHMVGSLLTAKYTAKNRNKHNNSNNSHSEAYFDAGSANSTEPALDLFDLHIIGTCRDLEKSFLRLTKAPSPSEVRPLGILTLSLQNVKDKWRKNQDYYYACDQLKSIRQDLTVQGIRDPLTIDVYETHARIAMEKGDHEEFNQCQTQLKMLYSEMAGLSTNEIEFTAYRILYYIFTKNTLDITTVLRTLTPEQRQTTVIAFSLQFRSAWALGNYCRLFQLYKVAPLMSGHMIDWFIERERKNALRTILKSYRPSIAIEHVANLLAFDSNAKCQEWLTNFNLPFTGNGDDQIDCKNAAMVTI